MFLFELNLKKESAGYKAVVDDNEGLSQIKLIKLKGAAATDLDVRKFSVLA